MIPSAFAPTTAGLEKLSSHYLSLTSCLALFSAHEGSQSSWWDLPICVFMLGQVFQTLRVVCIEDEDRWLELYRSERARPFYFIRVAWNPLDRPQLVYAKSINVASVPLLWNNRACHGCVSNRRWLYSLKSSRKASYHHGKAASASQKNTYNMRATSENNHATKILETDNITKLQNLRFTSCFGRKSPFSSEVVLFGNGPLQIRSLSIRNHLFFSSSSNEFVES